MHSELMFKEALQLSPVEKVKLMELLFQSFLPTKNEALEMLCNKKTKRTPIITMLITKIKTGFCLIGLVSLLLLETIKHGEITLGKALIRK